MFKTTCFIACLTLGSALTSLHAFGADKDVAYLGPDRDEKMDVYLPSNRQGKLAPAILLIHGGGWAHGDKASQRMESIAETLVDEGYAVFSINYKLNVGSRDPDTNKYTLSYLAWPQNLYDCKSALRFIRAHADQYDVDPNRIALMGASAGGHLAMMLWSTADDADLNQGGLYTDQSNDVACMINLYGPYDTDSQPLSPIMGATWDEKKALWAVSSPKNHLSSGLAPILILHGDADKTVPVKQSRALASQLEELGVTYTFVEIEDAPHSFDLQPKEMDLRPVVFEFLETNL
ncbi:alpha/beta hydrolase [Cerasicoccus frondis]|uniref:alpha/beta hydrolase n=1 Tax=Cerasicoccus frondis TaxID=490090 RepID=UPI0028525042|nr:alpha/beta hydrolase [Cerasicoccus frondis]